MTTILAEFDAIIEILEAAIPANPESPSAKKLTEQLEKIMAAYFRKLERAFPYSRVEQLYKKHVKESLGSETRGMLDPLLATFQADLSVKLNGWLAAAYIHGQAEMITWGKTKGGIPIAYEGPPMSNAVSWAEKHGATLVTQMDQETKRRLAQTVSDGIKNKRGIPGLARDIRKDFGNMTTYRSQLIAKTETRQALFQASHDNSVAMGITGKEWVLGAGGVEGNCDQCKANAAVGAIPINQEFPNPEGSIHPGCTCAIAPAMLAGTNIPKEPELELPVTKNEPPVTQPAPPKVKTDSDEMKNLFDNKLKAGKGQYDQAGLEAVKKELRSVKLPDSHLATVRNIECNTAKVQKVQGAMAYCDGGNNIYLASKVAQENVTHEIGHAVFQRKILIRGNEDKWKFADIFNSSTKTGKGFVSEYAKSNVDEFFAESYAAFAKDPAKFTKLNKPMANMLKKYWK